MAIFIRGGLGSVARYGIFYLSMNFNKSSFPVGTLATNILSCTSLDVFLIYYGERLSENKILEPLFNLGIAEDLVPFPLLAMKRLNSLKQKIIIRHWQMF